MICFLRYTFTLRSYCHIPVFSSDHWKVTVVLTAFRLMHGLFTIAANTLKSDCYVPVFLSDHWKVTVVLSAFHLIQGRFTIAAKHHISVAEIYETELVDIERVNISCLVFSVSIYVSLLMCLLL